MTCTSRHATETQLKPKYLTAQDMVLNIVGREAPK